jgi:hypothetical protein
MPLPGGSGDPRTKSAAWKRKRLRVIERDGGICHICGQPGADGADHLVPRIDGGTDDEDNLAAVHHFKGPRCNLRRGAGTVEAARAKIRGATPSTAYPKWSRDWNAPYPPPPGSRPWPRGGTSRDSQYAPGV